MAGWVLGQAGLNTKTRKGLAALILGANMPDIDVFFGNAPWDPLAIHRGFTHGIVGGVLVMPPILAALLWALDRWQIGHDKQSKSGLPTRLGWLVLLCYLGALTHPLLDVLTTYSVQLLSPFSKSWYHADGLFIIDLWVWLALALGIGISKMREKNGRPWRWPAITAILAVLGYIGVNLRITWIANMKLQNCSECGGPPQAVFASPPPLEFWKRDMVWRDGNCYRRARYTPGDFGPVSECEPTNMDDPIVREAIRRDPALRKFLKWSILPQAEVQRGRCSAHVAIGDARYGQGRRSRLARESVIPIDGPGCPPSLDNSPPSS